MKTTFRPYQTESDYWRMREFLRQVYVLNNNCDRSWHVARLDYARWHSCLNCAQVSMEEITYLWEAEDQLFAFLMPDCERGEAHLNVHPELRTVELEDEMLDMAEGRLAAVDSEGKHSLRVWSVTNDQLRQDLLTRRGYQKGDWNANQWRRQLDSAIPEVPVASGYTIRPIGYGLELLERCYASGLGFHEGDIQTAVENRDDPTWYYHIQTAPLYRRDLDLVAVAPDGAIASYCTIWFDDVTRSAYFEPVATVPAHRRIGLGKAVMSEGLRRVQRMGATTAFVAGSTPAANALYRSVMGDDHELYESWLKEW